MRNFKTPINALGALLCVFLLVSSSCTKDDEVVKVEGCTDPTADNYNPDATVDDGSCTYGADDFDKAIGLYGGQYYDKFFSSSGTQWSTPSDPSVNKDDITNYGDFYRCKQCHGWDLLGRAGAYIGRAAKTTRPHVSSVNLKTYVQSATNQELFDKIKREGGRAVDASLTQDGTSGSGDGHPDYGTIFTDAQIWDIVKFLKTEVINTDILYDFTTDGSYPEGSISYSNIGKDGNAANGQTYYNDRGCGNCHGADGTNLIMEGRTLGKFLRDKPYEVHHKVKFGQLGSSMGPSASTDEEMKDVYLLLTDPVLFPTESPSDTDLEALIATTPPEIDGVIDAMWDDARILETSTVVPDPGDDVFQGYVGNSNDVKLRALYDDDNIYFLAEWEDTRKDLNRQTWYFDPGTSRWAQEDRVPLFDDSGNIIRQAFYEDKFSFLFNVNNSVANWNSSTCYASCHTGLDEADGFARHYTMPGESIDMWHWKSVRTGPNQQFDDQYQNDTQPNGRHSDDKVSGGYTNNVQTLVINGGTEEVKVPLYFIPERSYYYWIAIDEINDGTAELITEVDEDGTLYFDGGSINPNTETKFQRDGETTGEYGMPSVYTEVLVGSRGDITAMGIYTGSGWILEVKRALKTGDTAAQDVDFSSLEDQAFGISVFDNAGIAHGIKPGLLLTFKE